MKSKAEEALEDAVKTEKNGQMAMKAETIEETPKPKKKQAISKSYTVKSYSAVIEKMKIIGYVSDEEYKKLNEIKKSILEKYMDEF